MNSTNNNQQLNSFSVTAPKKEEYDLSEEKKLVAEFTEEIKAELWEKWQQLYAQAEIFPSAISTLNSPTKNLLLSFETTLFYNSLSKNFSFDQKQRDFLPRLVWQAVLQNSFSAIENNLTQHLQISPAIAKQISDLLNQKIFSSIRNSSPQNISPSQITQVQENKIEKLPLTEALKIIPEIGEQLITNEKIFVKGFPEPVRPSIKNWLADYYLNLGNERHNSMQRGEYIFRNKNGVNLPDLDRQRLDFILKASDENSILNIDATAKKILFPKFEKPPTPRNDFQKPTPPKNIPPAPPIPPTKQDVGTENFSSKYSAPAFDFSRGAMKINQPVVEKAIPNVQKEVFSSPQKMSFEKKSTPPQTPTPTPIPTPTLTPKAPTKIQPPIPVPPKKERTFSDMLSAKKDTPFVESKPAPAPAPASTSAKSSSKPSFSEELKRMRSGKGASNDQTKDKLVNVINLKDVV